MKKVAVVLAGCGNRDGSEIHESVLTLAALDRAGVAYSCFAPDVELPQVIDFVTGKKTGEKRNALREAARIARGAIEPLDRLDLSKFDGLAFPGGLGAASVLSNYSTRGPGCEVLAGVRKAVAEAAMAKKPTLAICIAPTTVAKALADAGVRGVRMTIGDDPKTASDIEAIGQKHVQCSAVDCVTDEAHKVVTTPAYMLASRISETAAGIDKAVAAFVRML